MLCLAVISLFLTDFTQLEVLDIRSLNMNEFRADILSRQETFKDLQLFYNYFFDLEIEQILKCTPNLKKSFLVHNNFKYNRIIEMQEIIIDKNIILPSYNFTPRKRDYTPQKNNEIHCLPEERWNMQFFARNEISLEHFKAIPHVNSKIKKMSTKIVDSAEDIDEKI